MKFNQRLLRYLVGVFIGLLVVVFFFGDHDWLGWTPKQRILFKLRETNQPYTDQARCWMDCYQVSEAEIDSILIHGDVLLKESNPQIDPRRYVIQSHEESKKNVRLTFTSSDSLAILLKVDGLELKPNCLCDQ